MTLNKPSGWEDWINKVVCIDCLEGMKQMPPGVVHCVVTSPPYFGLRDYQADGQMGLEKTPELYVSKMVEVFREVKRIMHPTATLWLNMGDSYWGSWGNSGSREGGQRDVKEPKYERPGWDGHTDRPATSYSHTGLKPKDLLEMPSRLVLALQADGWWLRCRIPWLKRNAMPESVQGSRWERHRIKIKSGDGKNMGDPSITGKRSYLPQSDGGYKVDVVLAEWQDCPGCPKCDPNDGLVLRMSAGRPTQAVEYVFLLQKSPECYYDGEAVRVPHTRDWQNETMGGALKPGSVYTLDSKTPTAHKRQEKKPQMHPSGRSRRNSDWWFESWQGLWTDENGEPLAFIVNPKPYKRAHFATFPPGLVIPCIRAGASERGACPECGSPWVRILQTKHVNKSGWGKQGLQPEDIKNRGKYSEATASDGDRKRIGYDVRLGPTVETKTLGWRPTCDCGKEPVPCLVCDPFAGTGTVIQVARKMGRNSLGFEISEEYVKKYCGERLAQGVFDLTPEGL